MVFILAFFISVTWICQVSLIWQSFLPPSTLRFHPVRLSPLLLPFSYSLEKPCLSTSRDLEIQICLSSHLQTARSGLSEHSIIRQRFRWHSPGHAVTEKRIRKKKDNRSHISVNTAFQSGSASAFIFLSSDSLLLLRRLLFSCLISLPLSLFDQSLLSSTLSLSIALRGKLEYVVVLLFFLIPCWSHIIFRFCSKWVASNASRAKR